jgi:general stress protein YciG
MVDGRARTSERAFASMDEEKQREIARKGGRSVPPQARSFSKNPVLASAAGRKGGQSVPPHQRSFSRNPELASQAGRKGGTAPGGRKTHTERDRGEEPQS